MSPTGGISEGDGEEGLGRKHRGGQYQVTIERAGLGLGEILEEQETSSGGHRGSLVTGEGGRG